MIKTITIFLLAWCFPCKVYSQTVYPTRDSDYIFWQHENRITFDDYKWPWPSVSNDLHAEIALWTVLDLPQNVEKLTLDQARIYIAPVCGRYISRADTNDSVRLAIDNIYFDILELSARAARIKLSQIPNVKMSADTLSQIFKEIVRNMHKERIAMNRSFLREFKWLKNKNAVAKWQETLKLELEKSTKWSTQPIECYRFLQNQPVEKGYVEDLNSNAIIVHDKYEMVLNNEPTIPKLYQISRLRK